MILPLEKQVINKEISQRIKELGVKQESCFTWVISTDCGTYMDGEYKLQSFHTQFFGAVHNYYAAGADHPKYTMYAAFTVAELGEMIQKYDAKFDLNTHMMQMDIKNTVQRYAVHIPKVNDWTAFTSDTEADSRGKMLIYLLENKLVKL